MKDRLQIVLASVRFLVRALTLNQNVEPLVLCFVFGSRCPQVNIQGRFGLFA